MFSVVTFALAAAPMLPFQEGQDARPARIQEVSLMAEGGFRLWIALDSISRPGSVAYNASVSRPNGAAELRTPNLRFVNVGRQPGWSAVMRPRPVEGLVRYMAA